MKAPPPDDRSPVAVAYAWAARITTISAEMIVPGMVGLALDRWLETLPAFTIIGFALGMTLGLWHLVKVASSAGSLKTTERADSREDDSP